MKNTNSKLWNIDSTNYLKFSNDRVKRTKYRQNLDNLKRLEIEKRKRRNKQKGVLVIKEEMR